MPFFNLQGFSSMVFPKLNPQIDSNGPWSPQKWTHLIKIQMFRELPKNELTAIKIQMLHEKPHERKTKVWGSSQKWTHEIKNCCINFTQKLTSPNRKVFHEVPKNECTKIDRNVPRSGKEWTPQYNSRFKAQHTFYEVPKKEKLTHRQVIRSKSQCWLVL